MIELLLRNEWITVKEPWGYVRDEINANGSLRVTAEISLTQLKAAENGDLEEFFLIVASEAIYAARSCTPGEPLDVL